MSHSVTEITCGKCNERFSGVLNDLFNVSKEYAATCPKYGNENFFAGGGAFVDTKIPENAVQIKYVAKL